MILTLVQHLGTVTAMVGADIVDSPSQLEKIPVIFYFYNVRVDHTVYLLPVHWAKYKK
jgi:hypothetical protein